ncbi:MAG: protein kinase [Acidobacteriia bacterium]|nr:protein kinase [Terriglobia bacterium]
MASTLKKAGRYEVISELGRGSMGVVYQGYDPVIGRTVAIKTLLTEGLAPQEFQEYKARFQREAQAAGVLTHPNIVTVYDFGEDSGVLYLAMEYLEGKSLEKIVAEQGVLPIETIIPMYDQVCSALDHAHTHNIVHRDIKPANIMILDSGLVKVTDFGIAKVMTVGMTQAGQILGTPNYMSPEQVKGRAVDGRADIFSLGVILYELVTGEKPFGGQNITTVIYKIINENPIPPRELDAAIHPGLNYIINKVLAKNPDERYQTCRQLAEDLRTYKNLGGQASPSATVVFHAPPISAAQLEAPSEQTAAPAPEAPTSATRPALTPAAISVDQQIIRPVSVQVIPPVTTRGRATHPLVWVLLTLVIAGALGGGGYFLFLHKPGPAIRQVSVPANPPPSNAGATSPASQPESTAPATPAEATENQPAAEASAKTGPAETAKPEKETPVASVAPTPARSGRAAPAPKFGQLLVTSNLSGAQISIDGRSDPGWVTPHAVFADIHAGTHLVTVSKDGYDDAQQSVTIEGGRTGNFNAQLSVAMGEVEIKTNPSGLEILIDGKSFGPSPVQAMVTTGEHSVTIMRPGQDPHHTTVVAKSGAAVMKTVTLAGATTPTGIVEVRTIPPGASVLADNQPVGGTTPTSFRLAPGHHVITVYRSGSRPMRQEVEVTIDGVSKVQMTFLPQ